MAVIDQVYQIKPTGSVNANKLGIPRCYYYFFLIIDEACFQIFLDQKLLSCSEKERVKCVLLEF